jgi:hypothetical protein
MFKIFFGFVTNPRFFGRFFGRFWFNSSALKTIKTDIFFFKEVDWRQSLFGFFLFLTIFSTSVFAAEKFNEQPAGQEYADEENFGENSGENFGKNTDEKDPGKKNAQTEIWNSPQGILRLERSHFKNDFYQLANFYQPQINPLYCSVASAIIILNALDYGNIVSQKAGEIHKPQSLGGDTIKYHLYLQNGFFNGKTEKIKKQAVIDYQKLKVNDKNYDPGIGLDDLFKMLTKVYNLRAKVTYATKNDERSVAKFRHTLKKVLADKENFIIANFDGAVLAQKTQGHVSPLAAYDEASDSVLVLDVALHKTRWYWAEVKNFYRAMNTKDNKTYRGYLVISH